MQRRTLVRTALAAMAVTAFAMTVVVSTTAGAAPPRAEHCVLRVVGQRPTGELETAPIECASTRGAALERSGATAAADVPIGYHYDGFDLTGDSVTVVGGSCIGGWLNLPASWINRISSTLHGTGCPYIRHYDNYNLVSPSQLTVYPGGNMAPSMNNRTNSIQYLP